MGDGRGFDPERVAAAEAAGWRAYYQRRWGRLLRLVAALSREQFGIPWVRSWLAAYRVAAASRAWAPADHDLARVRAHLLAYYRTARRSSAFAFDPERAADLELDYWAVHRRLAVAGQQDKTAFVDVLSALHAELFGIAPEVARHAAEWRVAANTTVDGITAGRSPASEADWRRLEDHLRQCYRAIARARAGMRPHRLPVLDAEGKGQTLDAAMSDRLAMARSADSPFQ